jgi:succinate dehydrogenase / fumarate reductase flavoprotein subunit
VWVPKDPADCPKHPTEIPESARDYYLERLYPSFGNLAPRDIASRAAKRVCDEGKGVGPGGRGVYLDFAAAIQRDGRPKIEEKYGNLFDMYRRITGENGYERPMRIYPALHYTMGGLWVDYSLMSNVEGLFVLGEANFSDHGANRLGASALMQGLADGYFVIPYTLTNWFALTKQDRYSPDHAAFKAVESDVAARIAKLLAVNGKKTAVEFHRELGQVLWDHVGMTRTKQSCEKAMQCVRQIREEFWSNVSVPGSGTDLNVCLERAGRVADFLEFGELLARDSAARDESCGGHFREEYQYDGEAKRDDANFGHVAAWEYQGEDTAPVRHKEQLVWESVKPTVRSYK